MTVNTFKEDLEDVLRELGEPHPKTYFRVEGVPTAAYMVQFSSSIGFDLVEFASARDQKEFVRMHLLHVYREMRRLIDDRLTALED
jgi:hypothetical protein